MKTFRHFILEAKTLPPGTLVMLSKGNMFNRINLFAVSDGHVFLKVNDLKMQGNEYVGIPTSEVVDTDGTSIEVLLPGLAVGETMRSNLQLHGLPDGAVVVNEVGNEKRYTKSNGKWSAGGPKVESFHFSTTLKYKRVK